MGRDSRLKKRLKSKVFRRLLERPDTSEKISICQDVVTSLLKSRSSDRRKLFREQLELIHQNLCSDSTDLLEWKEKYNKLQKEQLTNSKENSDKRCKLQDKVNELQQQVKTVDELERKCERHHKTRRAAETDSGKFLRLLEIEKSKNQVLQKRVKRLQEN